MMRVIGYALALVCFVSVSTLYAGSGYEAIPGSGYLKRKIGDDAYKDDGQSSLDRFYQWKQKSIEEENAAEREEPSAGEDVDTVTIREQEKSDSRVIFEPKSGELSGVAEAMRPREGNSPSEKAFQPDIETMPLNRAAPEYILGPGDVLEISVWKDEALSKIVPILPDGTIHFPLIGKLDAAGKTAFLLQQEIDRKISRFVPSPFVDVTVKQVNSMLIYVIGKVHNPGRFVLNNNVNVLQALAMAGGLNTFAKEEKIKIIRDTGGRQQILSFNYEEAATGRNLSQNFLLKRGDVIVVH